MIHSTCSPMKGRPASRRFGLVARLSFMLALTVLGAGCKAKQDAAEAATARPQVAASTVTANVEPFTRTISAIGSVVSRPGKYAALSAPSATRISKVFVSAGQRVEANQPLVEFEQSAFAAGAAAAQAALTAAERNDERAQRLSNEGIVPRKDAEQAAADLAKARTEAVNAQRSLQLSVLRSPVRGVVTRMSAVLGASADAGQVLVEVADPSAFDVVLSLGPTDASAIHVGRRVHLTAGEKTGGDPLGDGMVASVGASVDTTSRSVAVRVSVTSPARTLRLGESVYGDIAVETRPNAVVIPVAALIPGDEAGSYKVFVVDKAGVAHATDVKIGGRTSTKVEIVDGLSGGEAVVTQGAFAMQDSAKVSKTVPVKP
ncbi:MAG: efflux RND transporter periplasmic adaptor subunit [bacterium]